MSHFLSQIKDLSRGDADLVEQITLLVADPKTVGSSPDVMIRHLDALAFRLDGTDKPDLASRVYQLASNLAGKDHSRRWTLAAAEAQLRDICVRECFVEADALIVRLSASDADRIRPKITDALIDRAWLFELCGKAEASVQCYRLALELNGRERILVSRDGDQLPRKIRNLRRLQLDGLIEAGAYEDAVDLHETTRRLIGSGPLACYDIVGAATLAGQAGVRYEELQPPRRIREPRIKFIEPPPPLSSEPGDLEVPSQYLAFIDACHAFPRSNLVVKGGNLIYDLAAHPRRRDVLLQDGVNPDQIVMAAFGDKRALVEVPEDSLAIEAGLSMFGLQSRNYGHWFCEFVPRMLAYNDPRCPDNIPLCIDDHMPATHEEVVRFLDTRDRPIIKLPPKPIAFGVLGLAPVPAFFPFEMRPGRRVYDTIWPSDILVDLRERILTRAQDEGALSGRTGRKLFISRKAFAQRQLVNEIEIAERLFPLGFEIVTPETMTFLEQIEAFHSADVIVGSSSSALTNGLFCRSDCQIIGLIHSGLDFNFRGYTSFIEAGGAQITFLRGQTLQEDGHAFHANYRVAPQLILAALGQLLPVAPAPRASAMATDPNFAVAVPPQPTSEPSFLSRAIQALPSIRRDVP